MATESAVQGVGPRHSVRHQTIQLETTSEAEAQALRPRLEEINQRLFLPAIERIFDEVDVPGVQIEIERLEIDLGTLPPVGFEQEAARRLTEELRRMLVEGLRPDLADPSIRVHRKNITSASAELLRHYLLTGSLPFWGPPAGSFSFEQQLQELVERDSEAAVSLVLQLGRNRRVLERIVAQLPETALRQLITLLEPQHAKLLLGYLDDLQQAHRMEPIVAAAPEELRRDLWLLTLCYLVQERGSQFNRKSFVRSLLRDIAASHRTDLGSLLEILQVGLDQLQSKIQIQASLPAILTELIQEVEREGGAPRSLPPPDDERRALLQHFLEHGTLPAGADGSGFVFEAAFLELAVHERADLVDLVLRQGRRRGVLERIVAELSEAALRRLLGLLEPRHAVLILEAIDGLEKAGREPPLAAEMPRDLRRELWLLTLSFLVNERGSQFNRKSYVHSLLRGISASRGTDLAQLYEIVHLGLQRLAEKQHIQASLPSILGELVRESRRRTGGAEGPQEMGEPIPDPGSHPASEVSSRATIDRYQRVAALRYLLRYGRLPWSADPATAVVSAVEVLGALPDLPLSQLRRVFGARSSSRRLLLLMRAVRALPEERLWRWLRRLMPGLEDSRGMLRSSLLDFAGRASAGRTSAGHASAGHASAGRTSAGHAESRVLFFARLLAVLLDGEPIDLEAIATGELPQPDPEGPLPADPQDWPAHVLQAALAARLGGGTRVLDQASEKEPEPSDRSVAELVLALISAHPADGRYFFLSLRSAAELRTNLVREATHELFDPILELLFPRQEVQALRSLSQALYELPVQYRPRSRIAARQAILGQILRLGRGGVPLSSRSLEQILRQLFKVPLAEPVARRLTRAATAWGESGGVIASYGEAFQTAITDASSRTEEEASATPVLDERELRRREEEALREAVFAFLRADARIPEIAAGAKGPAGAEDSQAGSLSEDGLRQALGRLLEGSPGEVGTFLRRHIGDRRLREHWVETLSEGELARLVQELDPSRARVLLDTYEVLTSAWLETAGSQAGELAEKRGFWGFLLGFLAENVDAGQLTNRLLRAFFGFVAGQEPEMVAGTRTPEAVGAAWLESTARLARAGGQASLLGVLRRERPALLEALETAPRRRADASESQDRRTRSPAHEASLRHRRRERRPALSGQTGFRLGQEPTVELGEAIYIDNAGLVLVGVFLPQLFDRLGLLERDEEGKHRFRPGGEGATSFASRGAHLLQLLVDGRCEAPEPVLVLNKLLCGLSPEEPVERAIEPSAEEVEICESLLSSMIASWPAIANTSVAGLRETFLQREGKLYRAPDGWRLHVQRRTLDVLVDELPWSLSIQYHHWMPEAVHVTW